MDTTRQSVSPRQLAWLRDELPRWQAQGLVTGEHAALILDQYRAVKRAGLARLMLYLGAAFVGVGVIWLVAANLDQFPPLGRFLVVTAFWLGATAVAEALGARAAPGHGSASPTTGAARGLAALAFGAVVFQAAQSLQVPAYEPALVGVWAAGALLYAYAVRGVAPLLVGLVAAVVWLLWHVGENDGGALGIVLALTVAAAVAAGAAVLHDRFGPAEFAAPWREAGAVLALSGLFAAAVPDVTAGGLRPDRLSWLALALGVGFALAAAGLARGEARLEPLVALAIALVSAGLVLWDPGTRVDDRVGVEDWLHAGVRITAYVAAATCVAVLGIQRSSPRLTYLALAALVVFTTFQSFAVFARIIEGAWLFVVLGLVFLGSGYLFDRARRELTEAVAA
jgi:uncharacterized membrane protein